MDFDLEVLEQAANRWQKRSTARQANQKAISAGDIASIETPERIFEDRERLRKGASMEAMSSAVINEASQPLHLDFAPERVIGPSDFQGTSFLELGLAVARFVGRVNICSAPGRTVGFGTGFMVSPRLLLTNNHVLPDSRSAVNSLIEFDFQVDLQGSELPVRSFALQPQVFYLTDKTLDFSLVAVSPLSQDGIDLKHYSWVRLFGDEGKELLGDPLNIIQHPNGELKQVALRNNQLVDRFEDFLHYLTDTEPGSSGSPVFTDTWTVVALHHSGVPKMDDGKYIGKDGKVWKPGMDPDMLDWVANEGIRVSSLVKFIKRKALRGEKARLRKDLLDLEPPHPLEVARTAARALPQTAAQQVPAFQAGGVFTFSVPLQITVSLGGAVSAEAGAPAQLRQVAAPAVTAVPTPSPFTQDPSLREALPERRPESQKSLLCRPRPRRPVAGCILQQAERPAHPHPQG
jgi:V8-like Glu-specific endopeptidase